MAVGYFVTAAGSVMQSSIQETAMNKDQVNGRIKEVKGKSKEVLGKISGRKKQEVEGNVEKNIGKAQAGLGDLKNKLQK